MGIDLTKLENVQRQGSKTTARCPACAESGRDRKGEHLVINDDGRFGCVLFQGRAGHAHRRRIFELVGVDKGPDMSFEVINPRSLLPKIIVVPIDIFWDAWDTNFPTTRE